MDCAYTKGKIFVRRTSETCIQNHFFELVLLRELSDALYKVLVRLPLSG